MSSSYQFGRNNRSKHYPNVIRNDKLHWTAVQFEKLLLADTGDTDLPTVSKDYICCVLNPDQTSVLRDAYPPGKTAKNMEQSGLGSQYQCLTVTA